MSFLRLNNIILNTKAISSIKLYQNCYYINTLSDLHGTFFMGFGGFENREIIVDKDMHQQDYEKLEKWISENSN